MVEVIRLTNTEKLLEIVEYACDNAENWWDLFDNRKDAISTINSALRERPDEYQITQLLSVTEYEDVDEEGYYSEKAYLKCLKWMKALAKEELE